MYYVPLLYIQYVLYNTYLYANHQSILLYPVVCTYTQLYKEPHTVGNMSKVFIRWGTLESSHGVIVVGLNVDRDNNGIG